MEPDVGALDDPLDDPYDRQRDSLVDVPVVASADATVPPGAPGRREAILRSAAEVVGERGLTEARLAKTTRRADVSAPLAVYDFTSKDRPLAEPTC